MKKIALFVFVLILAACGPLITEGKIISKEYDDADRWTTSSYDCVMRDSDYRCTMWMWNDNDHYDEEHYYITIRDTVEEKVVTRTIEVPEQDYYRCEIGDHYPECEPR